MPNKINSDDNKSFLDKNPICDICELPIKKGDIVKQVFQGEVFYGNEEEELYVDGHYEVFHVKCNPYLDE